MRSLRFGSPALAGAIGFLLSLPALPVAPALSATDASHSGPQAAEEAAGSWTRLESGTSLHLNDIFGGAANAFAVGANGTLLFFDGISWTTVPTPTTSELQAVWAGASGVALAVGDAGRIVRFDGGAVTLDVSGTSANLRGVWGRSASDIYAVGDGGAIIHFDGSNWSRQVSGTMARLNDVWGGREQGVFAVGANGTIVQLDGDRWAPMPTPTTRELNGVWVGSGGALAVGDNGTVLSLAGGQWTAAASGTSRNLRGAWIISASRAFAVGDAGTILYFDNGTWSRAESGSYANLMAVNNGYAAGSNGTVLQNSTVFREVSNLRITEVIPVSNLVEVTNTGPAFESPDLPFCHRDNYSSFVSSGTFFEAGAIELFDVGLSSGISRTDSDLWLYRAAPFDEPRNIVHGVKYGPESDVGQVATATSAGLWPAVDAFAPAPSGGASLAWDGFGSDPRDWYVDETPTPGEENHTPVGSVANEILFPAGTQDFENVTLGDEASAIRDWRIDSTSGIKGIFTSHVVNNVDGTVALHGTSTRWLRVRDQDARDIRNRIYTAAVESPAVHDYTWSFRVNLEEPPAAGANAPALVVQHRLGAVFVNTWGIVFRGGTVHLFVTSSGGDVAATPLYELNGITGIGQWVDIEIDVNLTAGVVIANVNGQMRGGLPIAPDDRIDRSSHRLCYEGSGVGNVGTTLIDDTGVDVDTASSPPPGPGPDPGPGTTFTSIDATSVSGAIVLRWEVVGAELLTGFRISRWDDRDPTVIVVANVSPGTRTHIDTNVRGGRTYTYVVTALLLSGAEVSSPEVTASVSNRPRVLFHSLSAYASDTRVWLGWSLEGEESVVGYRLYRRESGGDETLIAGEDRLGNGMHAYEDDTVELWHSYEYVVAAVTWDSTEVRSNTSMVRIVTAATALSQSSPNPFRAQTRIEYTLPTSANVLLNVYDVRGKLVTTLDQGVRQAGMHAVTWDGRDHKGRQVGAGIYFYRLATPGAVITKKMVVVR